MSFGRQINIYSRSTGHGAREERDDLIAEALAETRAERDRRFVGAAGARLRAGGVIVGVEPMTTEEEAALAMLPVRGIETQRTIWEDGARRLVTLRLLAQKFDVPPAIVVEVWGRELMTRLSALLGIDEQGEYGLTLKC